MTTIRNIEVEAHVKQLVRVGLAAFLRSRSLADADGRSLHEYQASDHELLALKLNLHGSLPSEWKSPEHGIVVLLLSEWSYRNARSASGIVRNAASVLGVQMAGGELRERLMAGMKAWKLPAAERTDPRWNSTLLTEGGYPVHFSREGLAALTERVGHAFSWPELLRASEEAVIRHLTSEATRFPNLLATGDDVLFFAELFRKFADYCRALAMFELVPGRREKPEYWLSRIQPLASPELWLPLRTKLDHAFVEAFFPQLHRVNKVGWDLSPSLNRPNRVPSATGRSTPHTPTLGVSTVEPELQLLNAIRVRSKPGRPLYTYRISEEELQALRAEVAADIRLRRQLQGHRAARFCLFAAKELCRTYAGGAWKWEPVEDAVGWRPSHKEREDAVRSGMSYWQRPIHQVGNSQRLLMTLFMEGGLPLAALADGRELHLRQFFRALIAQAERYQTSASQFVQDQIQLLPMTFRTNEGVQNLSAELADAIVELRKKVPRVHAIDPIAYLDSSQPGWADNLPLQVDPETAREFLGGLLAIPQEAITRFRDPVEVETWLYDEPLRLERHARVREEISVRDMAQFLKLSEDEIRQRSRFSLSVVTITGERHNIAVVRLSEDETYFRTEMLPVNPVRDPRAANGQLHIVANAGDTDIAYVDVPGGEPLLEEVPWIFEEGNKSKARLLAQGSIRHRREEVIALFPDGGSPTQASPDTLVRSSKVYQGRQIVTVRGDVSWTAFGEDWSISTRGEEAERRYTVVGTTSRCGFTGSDFWDGAPSVYAINPAGRRTKVPDSQVEARIHGTREWRPFRTLSGELDIRVRVDGETVFRTTIVTLPAGTRVQVDTPRSSIVVHCPGLVAARLNDERIQARDNQCVVPYRPGPVIETTATLAIDLGSRGCCMLSVPAPIRAVQFVGRNGPVSGPIVFDRLGQIRAHAVAPTNEEFRVEGRIKGEYSWRPIARLHPGGAATDVWELGLGAVQEAIEDFFAASPGLDTEVELKITTPTTSRSPTLTVRRYEEKPEWCRIEDDMIEVWLTTDAAKRVGEIGTQLLVMHLRPLHDPSQPAHLVTRVDGEGSRWRIPTSTLQDVGSWLVTGTIRGRVRLRPVLIPTPGYRFPDDEPSALRRLMSEPLKNLRCEGLAKLVPDLCGDWSRSEWDEIAQILGSIDDLPPATFDIIAALVDVPEAACTALVRCGGDFDAFRRIWRGLEKLPFLWSALPLEAWMSSARKLKKWVQATGEAAGVRSAAIERQLLTPLLKHFTPLCKVVEEVFGTLGLSVSMPASTCLSMTVGKFVGQLKSAIHALNVRHDGQWWPSAPSLLELKFESEISIVDQLIDNTLGELGKTYRRWVLRAPVQLGLAAGFNVRLTASSLLAARTIRTFDPVWFEDAHALGFELAAGMQLRGSK